MLDVYWIKHLNGEATGPHPSDSLRWLSGRSRPVLELWELSGSICTSRAALLPPFSLWLPLPLSRPLSTRHINDNRRTRANQCLSVIVTAVTLNNHPSLSPNHVLVVHTRVQFLSQTYTQIKTTPLSYSLFLSSQNRADDSCLLISPSLCTTHSSSFYSTHPSPDSPSSSRPAK